ncbi:MAG TPA: ribose 5-phosphate isomerase A [Candidatus Saccharimonadales bacterium]|nr:ribose 5-phosphate isomerase A [Candidatus Saccharimonadales bacterium]
MKWTNTLANDPVWGREITHQHQKEQVALKLAQRLKNGDVVGVGSGSTSFLTLRALAQRRDKEGIEFRAIPTSIEMELACSALSVPTTLLRVERPDWSFDGADEIDSNKRMIKGRGGALLREKLMMQASKKVYIVIDESKHVTRLGQNFPVPIEIQPEAIHIVETSLKQFDTITKVVLRRAVAKDGPVITENANLILDVTFSQIDNEMEHKLKSIVGVVETGLFIGYPITLVESDKL